ncbi:DUF7619 domain-containing protein [Winogradskyella poriferorum]|uniref:DUF7619 domain-containing protein n=1 Tax=Winogradskyella poriferorum TaxID=307627 RepID=UPI003D64908F
MNKNYLLLFFVFISLQLSAQVINIPDIVLKDRLVNHNPIIDTNANGEIEINEALIVNELNLSTAFGSTEKISDLTGLEEFVNVIELYAYDNLITTFDFSVLGSLQVLDVSTNQLSTLNVSQNENLVELHCNSNSLTELDFSQNLNLIEINCSNNPLTIIDLSQNSILDTLNCSNTSLSELDLTQNTTLEVLYCWNLPLEELDLSQNGNINLLDLRGCSLTSLNLINNQLLTYLNINDNPIDSIDLSINTQLKYLTIGDLITDVDLSNNIVLESFESFENPLTSVDFSNNNALRKVVIRGSNISELNLLNHPQFQELRLQDNSELSDIDLSGASTMDLFFLRGSDTLTELDLSQNDNLSSVLIFLNYFLNRIDLKNGNNQGISNLNVNLNYNLETICVDDVGYAETNLRANVQDQTIFVENCSITDVNYNLISGVVTFDEDNNGCDNALDPNIPNVLITANDGTNEYGTFTNSNGGYVIDVPTGTYTTEVNGLFEQYTVDPVSGLSSFVNLGETDTQDFCFTANQVFYDVEAVLLPLTVARPGFDATYQLVYKNNGLSITNGSIAFEFNDMQQTFVSSSQVPDVNNVNSLSFNYSNLQPFETRTIDITLNTFSPPTVNNDDILNLTASIQPTDSDIAPENNVYTLEQVVVNSYDPNDKQVLQGAEITMEQADEYLDYLIRFQNTGTASAINVAITDQLSNDLDWSTIQPLSSSHDYYARITNGNFVEFIFDNINLPAEQDDAEGSNGFVAFRIKPKSDVVVGDVITGLAKIYFDFNAPIITNTVSTEIIEPLSLNDYSIENQVTLYPNPTSGLLNLKFREDIVLSSVIITNISGSKVFEIKEPVDNIDLLEYPSGVYFIKFITDKGAINKRIVKN